MNSNKILLDSYAAFVEAELLNLEITESIIEAEYIVNPCTVSLVGRKIIINLPTDLDLNKLSRFNQIISRFPLEGIKHVFLPYTLSLNFTEKPISNLILTKELLKSNKYSNYIKKHNFLISIEPFTNGYLNLLGILTLNSI